MTEFNAVWERAETPPQQGRDRRPRCVGRPRSAMTLDPAVAAVRGAVRRALADVGEQPVLVACSGGADSLALLAATVFEGRDRPWRVVGVTVDHGLQPGSAERADGLVARMATLGVDETVAVRVTRRGVRARDPRPPRARRATPSWRRSPSGSARTRCCSATPSTTRPRPCCSASPAAAGGRSLAGHAPRVRRVPPAAARRQPRADRGRLPCRGHRVVDRPPQQRPGLHPRPDPDRRDADARARARPRRRRGAGPHRDLSCAADVELLDAQADGGVRRARGRRATLPVGRLATLPDALRLRVLRLAALRRRRDPQRPHATGTCSPSTSWCSSWRGQRGIDLPGQAAGGPGRRSAGVRPVGHPLMTRSGHFA